MRPGILTIVFALAIAIAGSACGKDEDPAEFARKQAEERQKKNFREGAKKVKAPVQGGKKVACEDLVKPEIFSKYLEQEVTLTDFTAQSRQRSLSAECKLKMAGEVPTAEEQRKLLEQHGKVGAVAGDSICELRIDCSKPDTANFVEACTKKNGNVTRDLGVQACVTISQRGPKDAYRYLVIEPDTGCVVDVLGGPSIVDEPMIKACAQAALESITASSLDKYK